MSQFHRDAPFSDIHRVYAYTYASASARNSASGFLDIDVGKMARQTDDESYWMLTGYSPIAWKRLDITGNFDVKGTRATPINVVAGTGIAFVTSAARQYWFVEGTGGVDITANPQIAAGSFVGEELVLVGTSDTNFVLLDNGTGLALLQASHKLGLNNAIYLVWDGTNWVQLVIDNELRLTSLESPGDSQYEAGNSGTTLTVNWSNGPAQKITMTGNCTLTLSNPKTGFTYLLVLLQDATGGRTMTWPSSVKWPGNTAPTLSALNKVDLVSLYYDGTYYYGNSSLNYL